MDIPMDFKLENDKLINQLMPIAKRIATIIKELPKKDSDRIILEGENFEVTIRLSDNEFKPDYDIYSVAKELEKELEAVTAENIQLKSRLTVLQIELAHKNAADSKLNFNS